MLKTILTSLTVVLVITASTAQSPEDVVKQFFQYMYDTDTTALSQLMLKNISLATTYSKGGVSTMKKGSRAGFLASVAAAQPGELDEHITDVHTVKDGSLAVVSMDYTFYHKDKQSHCGINVFTLAEIAGDWQVVAIADTRRTADCQPASAQAAIGAVLDQWHVAAAQADSAAYFGLLTPDAVFVGTDASEVWSKSEFLAFAAPYFAKGSAWDFKKTSRHIYSEDYESIAWFDEMLDTWMGPCRGSGVMLNTADGWRVKHYVLSVTVPNDDIQEFIKIGKE